MKSRLFIIAFAVVLSGCYTSMRSLDKKPAKYDGRTVRVKGRVETWIDLSTEFKFIVLSNKFDTRTVIVLAQVPKPQKGKVMTVRGTFRKNFHMRQYNMPVVVDSSRTKIVLHRNIFYGKYAKSLAGWFVNEKVKTTYIQRDTLPPDID